VSADLAAAPSGVVTFLFTDVEGSTRRWESDADGMRAALAAAGCVPYKSGKLWSRQVRSAEGYFHLLELIKRGVDPHGVLARGNLRLG
jgi:FAD/FMN-containing dehydrogenase